MCRGDKSVNFAVQEESIEAGTGKVTHRCSFGPEKIEQTAQALERLAEILRQKKHSPKGFKVVRNTTTGKITAVELCFCLRDGVTCTAPRRRRKREMVTS